MSKSSARLIINQGLTPCLPDPTNTFSFTGGWNEIRVAIGGGGGGGSTGGSSNSLYDVVVTRTGRILDGSGTDAYLLRTGGTVSGNVDLGSSGVLYTKSITAASSVLGQGGGTGMPVVIRGQAGGSSGSSAENGGDVILMGGARGPGSPVGRDGIVLMNANATVNGSLTVKTNLAVTGLVSGNGYGLTNLNVSADTNFVRRTGGTITGNLHATMTNGAPSIGGHRLVLFSHWINTTATNYIMFNPTTGYGLVRLQDVNGAQYRILDTSWFDPSVGSSYPAFLATTGAVAAADAGKLDTAVWASASSTTNSVKRTGDTITGHLTNAASLYVLGSIYHKTTSVNGTNQWGFIVEPVNASPWNYDRLVFNRTYTGTYVDQGTIYYNGGFTFSSAVSAPSFSGSVSANNLVGDIPAARMTNSLDARYVNASGDTVAGVLTLQSNLAVNGVATILKVAKQGDISMGTFTNEP